MLRTVARLATSSTATSAAASATGVPAGAAKATMAPLSAAERAARNLKVRNPGEHVLSENRNSKEVSVKLLTFALGVVLTGGLAAYEQGLSPFVPARVDGRSLVT